MLGQDGAVVFLPHGSQFIEAHACRAQPLKSTLHMIPQNEKQDKNIDQVQKDKSSRSDSDSEMDNNNISKTPSNKSNQYHDKTTNSSSLHSSSLPSTSLPPAPLLSSKEQTSEATNTVKQNQSTSLPSPSSHIPVKENSIISFNIDNINYQAKVLIRARKASGEYRSCYNNKHLSPDHLMGQQTWINLDNIDITYVGNKPETTKTIRYY